MSDNVMDQLVKIKLNRITRVRTVSAKLSEWNTVKFIQIITKITLSVYLVGTSDLTVTF